MIHMVEPTPFRRPIHWDRLRSDEAERIVHAWAQDTSKIIFISGWHAGQRASERDINQPDVYRILCLGQVVDEPRLNDKGDWEVLIRRRMKGSRDAGVVTIIIRRDS